MNLKFKSIHPDFVLPEFATPGSAGFDLIALADGYHYSAATISKIPLGFAVEIPPGYAMFITARSGVGYMYGAGVPQGYGLIDSDYRGEVCMLMTSKFPFGWSKGDAIGQAVIMKVERPTFEIVQELSPTQRGEGGFGSTDKKKN